MDASSANGFHDVILTSPEPNGAPSSPHRRGTLPHTAIVGVRKMEAGQIDELKAPKMKRSAIVRKLLCSFFGECLARCLLLGLCAVCIWRLTVTDLDFPHWGYALLGLGALLSICDGLQALWYKAHLHGYWHFYKYMHWRGRTWMDPNTFFCLLTIIPALAFTELAIYNSRFIDVGALTETEFVHSTSNDVTSSVGLLLRRRREINATDSVITTTDFATTVEQTSEVTTASTITFTASSTQEILAETSSASENEPRQVTGLPTNATDPQSPFLGWGRDWSLLVIHHVTCLLLVMTRVQIRRPESLQRIHLNSIAFEMLLHALDLDSLIVSGLEEDAVLRDFALFVGAMALWGVGFLCLIFILSRRHEGDLFPSDRKKLETFYACVILLLQDLPRLAWRIAVIALTISWDLPGPDTYTSLFAMKNLLCIFLYSHRLFVMWDGDSYADRY